MKNNITSFKILTGFLVLVSSSLVSKYLGDKVVDFSPDLPETIFVVEIRLYSRYKLISFSILLLLLLFCFPLILFSFRHWASTVLIVKVTFGMFELTAPYSSIVVSMVVMERVTRAGTAERFIQKQHQLRITSTTAGM